MGITEQGDNAIAWDRCMGHFNSPGSPFADLACPILEVDKDRLPIASRRPPHGLKSRYIRG
jgi:hypothetical protein